MRKWDAAYIASSWFFIFAAFHALWAGGYHIGLPGKEAALAFRRSWFEVYNIVAAILCVCGGVLSLYLLELPVKRWKRRLIKYGGWTAAVLLIVRSLGALVQAVYSIAMKSFVYSPMLFWDLWFCIGTLFFIIAFISYRKRVIVQKPRL